MRKILLVFGAATLFLSGCASENTQAADDTEKDISETEIQYSQISQDEAMRIMEEDDGYIILDVRTQEEYSEGHIPGAICIPNETITDKPPMELPDMDQKILVYCRSGRRSKEAAGKLSEMGYTNIIEFGGINTWTGEIVTDEN